MVTSSPSAAGEEGQGGGEGKGKLPPDLDGFMEAARKVG